MSESTLWWILAGGLVGLELISGTFYLLMLAVGAVAGAALAHAGLPLAAQLVAAAVVGGGAVLLWHRKLRSQDGQRSVNDANPDTLDVGKPVHVTHWKADGTAHVRYRGTDWLARYQGSGQPQAGQFRIVAIDSNQLILEEG